MVDIKDEVEELLTELRTARDELKVQMHLAKGDAAEEWKKAEASFQKLENKGREVGKVAKESSAEVLAAARLLADEVRKAFGKVRSHL